MHTDSVAGHSNHHGSTFNVCHVALLKDNILIILVIRMTLNKFSKIYYLSKHFRQE